MSKTNLKSRTVVGYCSPRLILQGKLLNILYDLKLTLIEKQLLVVSKILLAAVSGNKVGSVIVYCKLRYKYQHFLTVGGKSLLAELEYI